LRSRPPPLGRRVRLALLSVAGASVLVLTLGFDSAPFQASATGDPVIAAAGDIACDPTSSSFNGGLGTDTKTVDAGDVSGHKQTYLNF